GALVFCQILHPELAKQLAATLKLIIEPLKHAQAELTVALDRDHLRMRQPVRSVALELHALLEIDEIELDLLRTAPQGEICDDGMEERRFSGTGFSSDQHVLPRAFADGEILQLGRARAADRH